MTRRDLLATMAAVAAPPDFDRIDTHLHIYNRAPALFEDFEKSHWRGLTICLSETVGDERSSVGEQMTGASEVYRATHGRLSWASSFDARGFEAPDFAGRVVSSLERTFREGAIAVKIWKNIGMSIRAKSGEYLLPDNAVFTPIYNAVQKADRTLIAHLAEPDGAWMALNDSNPEIGYYGKHPEWSMYNKPGVPSKEAILAARDRILERYPKLRLVGCHLGSDEEHWERLAKRLDRYPNFAVDTAARVRYFILGDHDKAREFLIRYQDRVLYATDSTLRTDDAEFTSRLRLTHEQDWKFFATRETIQFRGKPYQGLGLPEAVVRKLFHGNAQRWLPGIVKG